MPYKDARTGEEIPSARLMPMDSDWDTRAIARTTVAVEFDNETVYRTPQTNTAKRMALTARQRIALALVENACIAMHHSVIAGEDWSKECKAQFRVAFDLVHKAIDAAPEPDEDAADGE